MSPAETPRIFPRRKFRAQPQPVSPQESDSEDLHPDDKFDETPTVIDNQYEKSINFNEQCLPASKITNLHISTDAAPLATNQNLNDGMTSSTPKVCRTVSMVAVNDDAVSSAPRPTRVKSIADPENQYFQRRNSALRIPVKATKRHQRQKYVTVAGNIRNNGQHADESEKTGTDPPKPVLAPRKRPQLRKSMPALFELTNEHPVSSAEKGGLHSPSSDSGLSESSTTKSSESSGLSAPKFSHVIKLSISPPHLKENSFDSGVHAGVNQVQVEVEVVEKEADEVFV